MNFFWPWRRSTPVSPEHIVVTLRGRIIDGNIEEARVLLMECMGRFHDDDLRERVRRWMEKTKY